MASETVVTNDWPLLPVLYRALPLERHFTCKFALQSKSVISGIRSRDLWNTRPPGHSGYQCMVFNISNQPESLSTAQKISMLSLFAAAQQPHSRDIYMLKICYLLINGLNNMKVCFIIRQTTASTYLATFSLMYIYILIAITNYEMMQTWEYQHIQQHMHNKLLIRYRIIMITWNNLTDELRSLLV